MFAVVHDWRNASSVTLPSHAVCEFEVLYRNIALISGDLNGAGSRVHLNSVRFFSIGANIYKNQVPDRNVVLH